MTEKSKHGLAVSLIIIILLIAALVLFGSKSAKNNVATEGWQTYSGAPGEATFKYPESVSTPYVIVVDWPPKVQVLNGPFECTPAGNPIERAGETSQIKINGRKYCVTEVIEGAAGTFYHTYAYGTEIKDKVVIYSFSLGMPNCANFDAPEKKACEVDQDNYDISSTLDLMAQSTTLK